MRKRKRVRRITASHIYISYNDYACIKEIYQVYAPKRGAGSKVVLGLFAFGLLDLQHVPEVQFTSEPVA